MSPRRKKKPEDKVKESSKEVLNDIVPSGNPEVDVLDLPLTHQPESEKCDSAFDTEEPRTLRYFVVKGRVISCKTRLFTREDSEAQGGLVPDDVIGGIATLEDLVKRGLLVKE